MRKGKSVLVLVLILAGPVVQNDSIINMINGFMNIKDVGVHIL